MRKICFRLSILVLLFNLMGCGIVDELFLPAPGDTAREIYEAGMDAMQDKFYSEAAKRFTQLKDRYPFSPYTPQAELYLGDALFLGESYRAAAEAYKEFESLHPSHEQIPYVLFQIGVSYTKAFSSIDKPAHHVTEASEYFKRLKESYPNSQYTKRAEEYLVQARKFEAEHELFVADFYFKRQRYLSAWQRYASVAETYTDLEDVQSYAEARAKMAYYRYQEERTQALREETKGSWKDYFDWL